MSVAWALAALVEACRRRAGLVVLAGVLLGGLAIWASSQSLSVQTDTDKLFAETLPWRQHQLEQDRLFPQFNDLLVGVVDADTPEIADATATDLAARLAGDAGRFHSVRRPDALPFFADEGLLFLSTPELQALLDRIIDAQPFLGQLVADPSARGLFAALSLVAMGVTHEQANLTSFEPALRSFHAAIGGALAGQERPLSWASLLGGALADKAGPYRFVLAQPDLDYGALQPGGAATAVMRAAIADLPYVRAGQARVRITGSVALSDEEFATVAQGALIGTLGSVGLVALWLFLAVRSWRLVLPIILTLVLGLLLTTGFAAAAVGTLNLVSVAFAILFVGLAVDFSLQFCVRYREARRLAPSPIAALPETARRCGGQILVAATATAAGFLAFVPTDFVGVAQLGLIAGVGMLTAFACTLTFLPALLHVLQPPAEHAEIGFRFAAGLDGWVYRTRLAILGGFAAIAVLGVALVPHLSFDADPLHTKDPTTEAMRTLRDLSHSPLTSPFTAEALAPDADAADALAQRLAALPGVAQALSVGSFVPGDQAAKLAAIADAAGLLGPTLSPRRDPAAAVTPEDIRLAAHAALAQIAEAGTKLPPHHPLLLVGDDLRALATAPDARVMAVNDALTRFLPPQIEALRRALQVKPVTRATLPPELARDWVLPDGRARAQAVAATDLQGSDGLREFAAQVLSVAPEAVGPAVSIVATSATVVDAFRTAAAAAGVAIALILLLALRRVLDVALVLAPLLLSALMTVILTVALPLPLNFANIIALPLLLGVGVSFNIYFVMNWRAGETVMLGSATARGVVFSALTTGTAFGSLALSHHPGTASMGALLLLSLGSTLVASLAFVPALLAALRPATKR